MTYRWPINMTGKPIQMTALDGTSAIDLTDKTVRLGILLPDGTTLTRTPTVVSAVAGTLEYYPVAADVATVGTRLIQLHIWDSLGRLITCPQTETHSILVWSGVPVTAPS